ncbi:hypothetical protein, partial [Enterobacter hormaechei]|uniref:hypothetical protein n=1 Tax=Enterobacter hormaechei TaxID=158836 RepID=UPI001BCCB336
MKPRSGEVFYCQNPATKYFLKINSFQIQPNKTKITINTTIVVDDKTTMVFNESIETKHRQLSEVSQRRIPRLLIKNSTKQQITRSAPGKLKWRPMGLRQVCNA